MNRYAKTIAAVFGALGTWGATAYADDAISKAELFGLLIAFAGIFAVYQVPNKPPTGEPSDPNISEQGQTNMYVVLIAVVTVIIVIALMKVFKLI